MTVSSPASTDTGGLVGSSASANGGKDLVCYSCSRYTCDYECPLQLSAVPAPCHGFYL